MYQKTTQEQPEEYCSWMWNGFDFCAPSPRKTTLAALLQFACAYHVEKKLPLNLSEFILN